MKEQRKKYEKEENDICDILFQLFLRKNSNLLYFQTPYIFHFIHSKWFKTYD
jgi:hypothetical protein